MPTDISKFSLYVFPMSGLCIHSNRLNTDHKFRQAAPQGQVSHRSAENKACPIRSNWTQSQVVRSTSRHWCALRTGYHRGPICPGKGQAIVYLSPKPFASGQTPSRPPAQRDSEFDNGIACASRGYAQQDELHG